MLSSMRFLNNIKICIYIIIGLVIGVIVPILIFQIVNINHGVSILYLVLIMISIVLSIFLQYKRTKSIDVFSPVFIPNLLFFLIYVIKPFYILYTGEVGVGEFNLHYITESELKFFKKASLIALITVFIYNLIIHFMLSSNRLYTEVRKKHLKIKADTFISSNRLYFIIFVSCLLSLLAIFYFIQKAGNLSSFFNAISLRNAFFKGEGYILLFTNFAKLSLFLLTIKLLCSTSVKNTNKLVWLFLLLLTLFITIMTGGRSTILYAIVVLIVYKHYLDRSIKITRTWIPASMILFLVVVVYRIFTRDIYFSSNVGKSYTEIFLNAITNFPKYFLGGYDVIQFDSLMVIVEKVTSIGDFLLGQTILAAILSPIPSSLNPNKEYGAMTYFTKNYFPEFYFPNKVELNASLVGEYYLNFGIIGIILGTSLLACLLGFLYIKAIVKGSVLFFIVYSITIVRLISLIRGDFFNFSTFYFQDIIPLIMMYIFLRIKILKTRNS